MVSRGYQKRVTDVDLAVSRYLNLSILVQYLQREIEINEEEAFG
jgi:hypothetical protein